VAMQIVIVEPLMPLVFRAMKRDEDGLPTVERSASGLGVRPGTDVDVDARGNAAVNGKGMSVSPAWRAMSIFRIPKRKRDTVPGARGSNNTFCFRFGEGPFQAGEFAAGLDLVPDSPTHGCVTPAQLVPLAQYENDLAATRTDWQFDEN
jgi:hypothetical protein